MPHIDSSTESPDAYHRRHASRYQHSWMSNSKWTKVLDAMAHTQSGVTRCAIKTIDQPVPGPLSPWLPREDPFHRGCIVDALASKWIEWIRFPRRWRTKPGVGHFVEQDVETLAAEISAAAHAKLELDDESLWLYGYTGLLPEAAWQGRSGTTGSR